MKTLGLQAEWVLGSVQGYVEGLEFWKNSL